MATHNDTGLKGEKLAKEFLEADGYVILETNYRYKKAEIDIIALKDTILAIIEVKTRTSTYFGEPESFVNNKKIKLVVEAANAYIQSKDIDYEVSLDIVSVVIGNPNKIDHIKNAYYYF